jgi:D-3-phosphoglycerate dehydrogenase
VCEAPVVRGTGAERSDIELERIGVTSRFFHALPYLRQELEAAFPAADIAYSDPAVLQLSREQLVDFLADRQAAVIGLDRFDAATLDKLPDLRVVSCCSAGLDHIDPGALAARGVRLGWIPGVNKVAVAELTLSLMIALLRRVNRYHVALRDGDWLRLRPGSHLSGRVVGIHGCGNIGQQLVRLLEPFGVEILACDREDYSDFYAVHGVTAVEPDELWQRSEILTLHLPKNSSTRRGARPPAAGRLLPQPRPRRPGRRAGAARATAFGAGGSGGARRLRRGAGA